MSIASEFSISSVVTAKPDLTDFQLRRRRAAKLIQFFGVDYRDLIKDVLESIEKGLEDEGKRGTLQPTEVEVFYFSSLHSPLHNLTRIHRYRNYYTDFER